MRAVTWSNGHIDRARTWQALLDGIRATQWHDYSEEEFRAVMAKRAWRWSKTEIDIGAPPARFFEELEYAKLLVIGEEEL